MAPPKYATLPRINTSSTSNSSSASRSNLTVHRSPTGSSGPQAAHPVFQAGRLLAGDIPIPGSPMIIPPTPHAGDAEEDSVDPGASVQNRVGGEQTDEAEEKLAGGSPAIDVQDGPAQPDVIEEGELGQDVIMMDSPEDTHAPIPPVAQPRSPSPSQSTSKQDSGSTIRPRSSSSPSPLLSTTSSESLASVPVKERPPSAVPDLASSPVEVSSPIDLQSDSEEGHRGTRDKSGSGSVGASGYGSGRRFQRGRVRSSWMDRDPARGEDDEQSKTRSTSPSESNSSVANDQGKPDRSRSRSPPHRSVSAIEVDASDEELPRDSADDPDGGESDGDFSDVKGRAASRQAAAGETDEPARTDKPVAQIFTAISDSPLYVDTPQPLAATDGLKAKTLAPPPPPPTPGVQPLEPADAGVEVGREEDPLAGARSKTQPMDDGHGVHPPQTYPHKHDHSESSVESPTASSSPSSPSRSTTVRDSHNSSHPTPYRPAAQSSNRSRNNGSSGSTDPQTPRRVPPRTQTSAQYNLDHGHGHGYGTGAGNGHTHSHTHTHSPGRGKHGHALESGHEGMQRRSSSTHRVLETLDARQHSDSEGRRMVNQYSLGPLIGRGAYGNVEKAIDVGTGQEYAIKEFSKSRLRRHQQMSNVARNRRARGGILPPAHPVEDRRKSPGEKGGEVGMGKDQKVEASEKAKQESKDEKPDSSERKEDPKPEDALALIRREVAVMKKLDHPNLVMLYEAIDVPTSDSLYLVIEYLPGGTLMEIHVDGRSSTPIPMETARDYFRQLVLGLEYLHENDIAHRDIKPDNILLSANRRTVKLCDFGVSEMFTAGDDRMHKSAGSPAFMSPEAAISNKLEIHAQPVDIWATGIVLFCMHRGRLPFSAHTPLELYEAIKDAPVEIPRDWNPDLKNLITRLLTKDPDERIKMAELRAHPWVTDNEAWPMPSTEENLYEIGARVEDPTQDEISKAFTSVRGVFTVIRAVQKMRRAALLRKSGRTSSFASSGRSSPLVHSPTSESAPSISSRPQDSSMDDYLCGSARQFQSPFSSASSQMLDSPSQSPMALQPQGKEADDKDVVESPVDEVMSPSGMSTQELKNAPVIEHGEKPSASGSVDGYFKGNR